MRSLVLVFCFLALCAKTIVQGEDSSTSIGTEPPTTLSSTLPITTESPTSDPLGPGTGSNTANPSDAPTSPEASTVDDTTTEEYLTTTEPCPSYLCINGDSQGDCLEWTGCNCTVDGLDFFDGELCEMINLDVTNQTSTARTVNITWPAPPSIDESEYSFVYRYNGSAPIDQSLDSLNEETIVQPRTEGTMEYESVVETSPFRMLDSSTARLINLNTTSWYVVCVLPNEEAQNLTLTNDVDALDPERPECFYINTQDNLRYGYTLAAFIIAGLIIVLIIALIIAKVIIDNQQNKKNSAIYYDGKDKKKKDKLLKDNSDTSFSQGGVRVIDLEETQDQPRGGQGMSGMAAGAAAQDRPRQEQQQPAEMRRLSSEQPAYPPPSQSGYSRQPSEQERDRDPAYRRYPSQEARENHNQGFSRDSYGDPHPDDESAYPKDDYSVSSIGAPPPRRERYTTTNRDRYDQPERDRYGPPERDGYVPSAQDLYGFSNRDVDRRNDEPSYGYRENGPSYGGYGGTEPDYIDDRKHDRGPGQSYGYNERGRANPSMEYIPEEPQRDTYRDSYEQPRMRDYDYHNDNYTQLQPRGGPYPQYSTQNYSERSFPQADY